MFTAMGILEFRPRFRFTTPLAKHEVVGRIGARLRTDNPQQLWLKDSDGHLVLSFPSRSTHAWSPQMDLNLEVHDTGTLVRCLIGPSPGIWMLFSAGYIVLSLLALTGITLGFAQLSLGHGAWGFWALPVSAVGTVVLVLMARAGRLRAADEMRVLKHFVDAALGCDCFKLAMAQAGE
ncbi:MAG: hypothetical protein GFGODING_02457 [Flavobacteriales bacterium]|nr:hypothetical protein [Flavobacteriales bacterium]